MKRGALCRRLNLRRILAGRPALELLRARRKNVAEEYAQRVAGGRVSRSGFELSVARGLSAARRDAELFARSAQPQSRQPDRMAEPGLQTAPAGARKVRVACVQYQMRKVGSFAEFARQVSYFVDVAADYRSDFRAVAGTVQRATALAPRRVVAAGRHEETGRIHAALQQADERSGDAYGLTIIAGSHPVFAGPKLLNIAHVCLPDGSIVAQPKLHITPNERKWWGISGGHTLGVVETPKAKIGVLICYDVEFPEAVRHLADEGAEILFVPFCTDNRQGYLRVRYCAQARAIENQIYVALAGNVGNLPDVTNMDVQYGQAAVFTPRISPSRATASPPKPIPTRKRFWSATWTSTVCTTRAAAAR
jgi:predicted amidohydrolase